MLAGLLWRQLHLAARVPRLHLAQPRLPEHPEASDASRGQTGEWQDARGTTTTVLLKRLISNPSVLVLLGQVGSAVQLHVHSSFPLMEVHYVVSTSVTLTDAVLW